MNRGNDDATTTRRKLLGMSTGVGVVGLAGCLSGFKADSSSNETDGSTTNGTTSGGGEGTDEASTSSDSQGHGHGSESLPEGPSASVEVKMQATDSGYHFSPHVAWVEQGGTVTFRNESGSHSATAYAKTNDAPQRIPEDAKAFDSGLLSKQGATFEHAFETPGVYDVFCTPHESTGMLMSVVVGEPGTDGQPGLSKPQDALPDAAAKKVRSLNDSCRTMLGGHHDDGTTSSDHHDDGTTSSDHHDDGTTSSDHHDDGTTSDNHHDDGTTSGDQHEAIDASD